MLTTRRIPLRELASLCRRLGTSIDAGVDDRRIWQREAEQAPARLRESIGLIRDAVASGHDLTHALARTGDCFPPLVHAMMTVGEQTGRTGSVLRSLAEHYENQLKLRRLLLSRLVWPAFQLTVAVGAVGILILIGGVLGDADLLGLGLSGTLGLMIYAIVIGCVIAASYGLVESFRRGARWVRPLQPFLLELPVIGSCLKTAALARVARTFHVTLETGMDVNRLIPLAFHSAGLERYEAMIDQAVHDVTAGRELHDALRRTRLFPEEFLNTVENGEYGGRLAESLAHLANQYEDQARSALHTLMLITGYVVWALVAIIIILLIFRLASVYFSALQGATRVSLQ